MPTPKNLLKITELGEISFVDKGDNPPAGAVILKSAPPTPGASVENTPAAEAVSKAEYEAIRKQMEEQAVEIAKMKEEKAMAATSDFCKSAGLDVAKLAAPIRAIEKAAPEAAAIIKAELAALVMSRDAAVRMGGAQRAGVGKHAGSASAQMDATVSEIMKRDGCDKASAYAKMLVEAPEIYKSYTAEQEA